MNESGDKPSLHPALRLCCGFALLGVVLLLVGLWRLHVFSVREATERHPIVGVITSSDEGAVRDELMWAAQRALAFAAGKERIVSSYTTLQKTQFCAFEARRGALKTLATLKGQELREGSLAREPGEAFQGISANQLRSASWRLVAKVGAEAWVFRFEWHDSPLSSTLQLVHVEALSARSKSASSKSKS